MPSTGPSDASFGRARGNGCDAGSAASGRPLMTSSATRLGTYGAIDAVTMRSSASDGSGMIRASAPSGSVAGICRRNGACDTRALSAAANRFADCPRNGRAPDSAQAWTQTWVEACRSSGIARTTGRNSVRASGETATSQPRPVSASTLSTHPVPTMANPAAENLRMPRQGDPAPCGLNFLAHFLARKEEEAATVIERVTQNRALLDNGEIMVKPALNI